MISVHADNLSSPPASCRTTCVDMADHGKWPCTMHAPTAYQRGVVTIEYALLLWLGVLPLLWLVTSGVMIFAAKQSLTLAAADGARAALRFQPSYAERGNVAKSVAEERMQWLIHFGVLPGTGNAASVAVSDTPVPCPSDADVDCFTVTATYAYNSKPFLPWTAWMTGSALSSSATIQLPLEDSVSAP